MATPTPLQHSLNERLTLSNQGQNLGLDQKTEKGLTDSSAPSISSEEAFTNRSGINEKALVRKMDWKLLPPLTLLYLLSFLDRSNGMFFSGFF